MTRKTPEAKGKMLSKNLIPASSLFRQIHQSCTDLPKSLSKSGISHIEVSSFVDPKRVPQMSDASSVFSQITRNKTTKYVALVPNLIGMQEAVRAKVDEVSIFAAASETFSKRNINCSIEESIRRFDKVLDLAKSHNIPVRGYISCVLGCPYEGAVSPDMVARVVDLLWRKGCYEISLGDTIGSGTPDSMHALLKTLTRVGSCPREALAVHCHETGGRALENISVAVNDEHAIQVLDASVGGLGGCPFAGPGAPGNVATEAVVSHLLGKGYQFSSPIDLKQLEEIGLWIRQEISKCSKAADTKD